MRRDRVTWEYYFYFCPDYITQTVSTSDGLGSQGWELVTVLPVTEGVGKDHVIQQGYRYIYKRPREPWRKLPKGQK